MSKDKEKKGIIEGRELAEKIRELKAKLEESRQSAWEDLPDIQLYMDQILSYLPRQHLALEEGTEVLTSSMVNNYIKKGLLPRARGKRYDKSHLAYLTTICLLKQVLTVEETRDLLYLQLPELEAEVSKKGGAEKSQEPGQDSGPGQDPDEEIKRFYEIYRGNLQEAYKQVSARIQPDMDREELTQLVLSLAISSYAEKLACQELLNLLKDGE